MANATVTFTSGDAASVGRALSSLGREMEAAKHHFLAGHYYELAARAWGACSSVAECRNAALRYTERAAEQYRIHAATVVAA